MSARRPGASIFYGAPPTIAVSAKPTTSDALEEHRLRQHGIIVPQQRWPTVIGVGGCYIWGGTMALVPNPALVAQLANLPRFRSLRRDRTGACPTEPTRTARATAAHEPTNYVGWGFSRRTSGRSQKASCRTRQPTEAPDHGGGGAENRNVKPQAFELEAYCHWLVVVYRTASIPTEIVNVRSYVASLRRIDVAVSEEMRDEVLDVPASVRNDVAKLWRIFSMVTCGTSILFRRTSARTHSIFSARSMERLNTLAVCCPVINQTLDPAEQAAPCGMSDFGIQHVPFRKLGFVSFSCRPLLLRKCAAMRLPYARLAESSHVL